MTAVEWLLENLNSEPYSEEEFNYNSDCWDKAKEMEKQQIIESYDEGQSNPYEYTEDNDVNWYNGKNYYINKFQNTQK